MKKRRSKRRKSEYEARTKSPHRIVVDLLASSDDDQEHEEVKNHSHVVTSSTSIVTRSRAASAMRLREKRAVSSRISVGSCVRISTYGDGFIKNAEQRGSVTMYEVELSWCKIYCVDPHDMSNKTYRLEFYREEKHLSGDEKVTSPTTRPNRQTRRRPTREVKFANASNRQLHSRGTNHTPVFIDEIWHSGLVRLHPYFFVNDNAIDTYLQYLIRCKFSEDLSSRVLAYSSYFYKSMWQAKPKAQVGEGRKMNSSERGYQTIKSWTEHEDIFSKDFLIFPIVEKCHWSVAILCNPSAIKDQNGDFQQRSRSTYRASQTRSLPRRKAQKRRRKMVRSSRGRRIHPKSGDRGEESNENEATKNTRSTTVEERYRADEKPNICTRSNRRRRTPSTVASAAARAAMMAKDAATESAADVLPAPVIILFDSLRVHRTGTITNRIRNYLEREWTHRNMESGIDTVEFNAYTIPSLIPDVPRQRNNCDCGIFALSYAEHFLKAFEKSSLVTWKSVANRLKPHVDSSWFRESDITRKRREILELFQRASRDVGCA